jgi:hypothetical protein
LAWRHASSSTHCDPLCNLRPHALAAPELSSCSSATSACPCPSEYCPAGQDLQFSCSSLSWYWPVHGRRTLACVGIRWHFCGVGTRAASLQAYLQRSVRKMTDLEPRRLSTFHTTLGNRPCRSRKKCSTVHCQRRYKMSPMPAWLGGMRRHRHTVTHSATSAPTHLQRLSSPPVPLLLLSVPVSLRTAPRGRICNSPAPLRPGIGLHTEH